MGASIFPSITGALMNGIATNIAAGGDTKKGLLMNAALLAGSQGMPGVFSNAGATAFPSTAANTAFAIPSGVNSVAASQSANLLAPSAVDFSSGIGSAVYQAPSLGGGPSTGMIPSSLATPPGFLDQIGKYAQQNPVLTNMAMQSAQQMMQQPEMQVQSGSVSRGQIAPVDFMSLLNPQQSTVIRPAMPSLL